MGEGRYDHSSCQHRQDLSTYIEIWSHESYFNNVLVYPQGPDKS